MLPHNGLPGMPVQLVFHWQRIIPLTIFNISWKTVARQLSFRTHLASMQFAPQLKKLAYLSCSSMRFGKA